MQLSVGTGRRSTATSGNGWMMCSYQWERVDESKEHPALFLPFNGQVASAVMTACIVRRDFKWSVERIDETSLVSRSVNWWPACRKRLSLFPGGPSFDLHVFMTPSAVRWIE